MPTNTKNNAAELGLGHLIASDTTKPDSGADPATPDPSAAVAQSEAPIATTLMGSNCGVRFALFTSDTGLLTKTLLLRADGTPEKKTAALLSSGTVENISLESFDAFGEILRALGHDQAHAYGVSLRGDGPIVSERRWKGSGCPAGMLLRNREHFDWPAGGGILMIDYDPPKNGKALPREELLAVLYRVCPELKGVAHFWWPSAGSCIYNVTTGEEIVGNRGQRVYVWVDDAREIPRVGKLLVARLWLAGYGRVEISSDSRLLERTIVDAVVWQPERLDFAAGSKCEPPLMQRRPAPLRLGGDAPLDTRALPELTEFELQSIERKKRAIKFSMQEEAKQVREKCIEAKAEQLQAKRGIAKEAAVALARYAYEHQRLMGDFILLSQDGEEVSVRQILANPEMWYEERFHDPLDPECTDERIAMVNLYSGGRPYLWSHAHGGARYELCRAIATIAVSAGGMAIATEKTLELMRTSMGYYERAGVIVVVTAGGAVQILGLHALKQRLEREISFQKWDGRQNKMKQVDCPEDLARRALDMRGERDLPLLSGVGRYPTMTPTGRVIARPGYDEETKLLLINPSGKPWPRVPVRPTDDEVLRALERLWAPFRLFPFVDEVSRAIFLAALLTAVVRRTLPTAPAFMFAAPAMGSGKTLLAWCVVELAGRAPLSTLPQKEEEIHKTIVSKLRLAPAALFFDNVVGVVNSESLNAMLTSEVFEGRILGVSETSGALPTNVLVVMTGNNARPSGDTCRRMLVCTIDAKMEDPYSRPFDFNPLDRVRADRMDMVVDALTILTGSLAAGDRRLTSDTLGSFDAWERLVRRAVVWVGELERAAKGVNAVGFGDPIANIRAQYAQDEETEALGALLETWSELQDGLGFKASDLFRALDAVRDGRSATGDLTNLGRALLDLVPKVQTARGLSKWLRNMRGRVVNALRIEGVLDRAANNTTWYVQRV